MNIILDIDGTLWNTTDIVAEAWNDIVEELGMGDSIGRSVTGARLQKEFGTPTDMIIKNVFPTMPSDKQTEYLELITPHEQEVLESCNDDLTYPNVVSTIHALSNMGHKLFIVSNCQNGYIELVMDKLGITECIRDFECFGSSRLLKSDNIRLIIKRNSLNSEETIYVGDTYGDYKACVEAQVDFVFAAYGFGQMPEDYEGAAISTFDELLTIVK